MVGAGFISSDDELERLALGIVWASVGCDGLICLGGW